MKNYHIFLLFLVLLAGCSSNESFTSFGKRKYTKGYFNDIPAERPGVVSKAGNNNKIEIKPEVERNTSVQDVFKDSASRAIVLKEATYSNKKAKHIAITINPVKAFNKIEKINDDKPLNETTTKPLSAARILFYASILLLLLTILFYAVPGGPAGIFFLLALICLIVAFCLPKNNNTSPANTGDYVRQGGTARKTNNSSNGLFIAGLLLLVLSIVFGLASVLVLASAVTSSGLSSGLVTAAVVVLLLSIVGFFTGLILTIVGAAQKTS